MAAKVLIVDDNEDNRLVLSDALAEEGYEISEADDGQSALDRVADDPPDVILLDVMMPVMDGIECCRQLKANESTRQIPIILVTALSAHHQVVEGLNAGATDYVAKPFVGVVVRARTRAALRAKTAHDQLKDQRDEIGRLANALEAKNRKLATMTETAHRFVDNVAHEFRTPLSVIMEFASIISDGLGGPVTEQQREYLEFIESGARDLSQMVDDFLDSSKLKAQSLRVDRRPQDIRCIVDETITILSARARQKQVVIETEIPQGLQKVFVDAEKVSRILINLAINAVKFSPNGTVVRIWARPMGTTGVQVGVTDQGPGLSAGDLAQVFQRFRQVGDIERASTKGFGLGLNIAKELIWLNLGSSSVESAPGEGSTFSFTVPAFEPRPILEAYMDRLHELDDVPLRMAVLEASYPETEQQQVFAMRDFIVSACYPMDLVLMDDRRRLVLVGSTVEPSKWIGRLNSAWANRSRLDNPPTLSTTDLKCIGSWLFKDADHLVQFLLDQHEERRASA